MKDNVTPLFGNTIENPSRKRYNGGNEGGGGDMSALEARVASLENTAARIEGKLDSNLSWIRQADGQRHSEYQNNRNEMSEIKRWMTGNTIAILLGLIAVIVSIFLAVIAIK